MITESKIRKTDQKGAKVDDKIFILPTPSCTGNIRPSRDSEHTQINIDRLTRVEITMTFRALDITGLSSKTSAQTSTKV